MGRIILIVVAIVSGVFAQLTLQGQDKANKETIKQAEELFEQGQYAESKKLYNQLVTYYPKDAAFNYRLGACILFTESDKEKALKYLEYAVTQPDVNPEAYYYLGKGYHYNYRFNEAAKNYNKFKANASGKALKQLPVDQDLRAANNGFSVLKNISEPKVYKKTTLSESDFYLSYKIDDPLKLLKLPSFLQSDDDKSKSFAPVTIIEKGSDTLFVAGFNSSKTHTDIFLLVTDAQGDVVQRTPLNPLNTPFDEAYPFYDKKTGILYFSSKGHNSMGGFDLFQVAYNPKTNSFGTIQNMDYAYNTPDDDFLYVTTESGNAFFASTRNNNIGDVTVFEVDSARRGLTQALLVGNFTADETKVAKITVEDSETSAKLPVFESRNSDGFYMTRLKANHRYRFLVEPSNSQTVHAGIVEIPAVKGLNPLKQEMYIVKEGDREKLVIKNLFDEEPTKQDKELMAQFLTDLSNLETSSENVEKNIALSNQEILAELEDQTNLLVNQANEFQAYANAAFITARDKTELAQQDIQLIEQLSETLPDESDSSYQDKKAEIEQLKQDAKNHAIESATSIALAETLEELAITREAEASKTKEALESAQNSVSENDRNAAIQSYLTLNEEVKVVKKPIKTQANEALKDKAIKAKREASSAKQRYEDLYDEEERLKKSIDFTKGQINQAKKDKMKKQLDADLEQMQADLSDLTPKVEAQYARYKKKEAIALALNSDNGTARQDILATIESDNDALTEAERATISGESNEVFLVGASFFKRDDYSFEDSPVIASEGSAPKVEEEVNEDLVELETSPEPTLAYNTSASPYTSYYSEQESKVNAIQDPYLKALNQEALYTAEAEAFSAEIDYLLSLEQTSEITERTDELRVERDAVNQKKAAAEQYIASIEPDYSTFEVSESESEYPSIQDFEDQYFFELEEAKALENQTEKIEKSNEINKRYLADLEQTKAGLESMLANEPQGTPNYESIENEIDALTSVIEKKENQIAFNNQVLNGVAVDSFVFDGLQTAFAANTTQVEPSSNPDFTADAEPMTETSFDAESSVSEGFVAESSTEDTDFENEPTTNSELDSSNESGFSTNNEEQVVETEQPSNGAEFKYFKDEEEIRKAPVYTGPSPYNTTYKSQVAEAQKIPNRVEAAKQEKSANEDWVEEINKELESLSYLSARASNDATKDVLEEKITSLRALKSERQAEVNRLGALEITLAESGYVTDNQTVEQELDGDIASVNAQNNPSAELVEESEEENLSLNEGEEPQEEFLAESTEPIQAEIASAAQEDSEIQNNLEAFEDLDEVENTEGEQAEELSFETDGIAAVAQDGGEDIDSVFTEQPLETQTDELAVTEEELVQEELETLNTYLVSYEEEADLAENQFNETQTEISSLQNQLAATKKKKDRQAIQERIDDLTEMSIMEQAMLRWKQAKAQQTEEAKETLIANPLAERPSIQYMAQANRLNEEAQLLKQEIQEKEDEIGAEKKKKKRKKMLEELEPIKQDANVKALEAKQAMNLALAVQEAEELTLKTTTAFSREIIVSLPETDRTLTEQEQSQIASSQEYQAYEAVRENFEKSIQEADVLYIQASEKEQAGRRLLSQAELSEAVDADSLRSQGNEEVRQAVNLRKQARALERDAYYSMNLANQKLLEIEDDGLKADVIALSQGSYSSLTYTADGDIDIIPAKLATDIFKKETQDTAYYSAAKPIPLDVELPEGVVYKVQVGAFSNPIPDETFKGFAPIVGEQTSSGLTRYTAGLFNVFDNANDAKNDIRNLGYADAFVVAYLNGERITLAEARALQAGQTLAQEDIPTVENVPDNPLPIQEQAVTQINNSNELDVLSVSERGELFYTVQIGVYSQEVSPADLFNISPINSDLTASGLIRYSTGVYNTVAAATQAKQQIQAIGIQDAFVTAYRGGQRVSVAEARTQANEGVTNQEAEPILEVEENSEEELTETTEEAQPTINFIEGEEPEETQKDALPPATAESENAYRVKVGPYSGQVPVSEASVILGMNSVGINIDRAEVGTTYFIGNYATEAEAEALKEIVISKGISNSEVVKFENGNIIE